MPPRSCQTTNAWRRSSAGTLAGLPPGRGLRCGRLIEMGEPRPERDQLKAESAHGSSATPGFQDLLLVKEGTMAATLRRLSLLAGLAGLAGLAVLAGICAEVIGHRAFARLVRRDVQELQARASTGRAGAVTEEMLTGLPEPVCRYLRYTGVVGKPVPGTIRLHQEGRMRPGRASRGCRCRPRSTTRCSRPVLCGPARRAWALLRWHGPATCTPRAAGGCWSRSPPCGRWPTPAASRPTRPR